MTIKIGLLGISIESNVAAPPSGLADFQKMLLVDGPVPIEALMKQDADFSQLPKDVELETVYIAHVTSGGPVVHADYLAMRDKMMANLQAQGPFDGLLVIGHGAGLTTELDDMDGDYLSAVRNMVGPEVPISVFLDLHGNISPAMFDAADIIVGMHENPHTDTPDRIRDAALRLIDLVGGQKLHKTWRSVPLITPQVTQLTVAGEPFGDLMTRCKDIARNTPQITDFSIYPGFAFNDASFFGFDVLAYGTDQSVVESFADRCADALWADRDRYRRDMTRLEDAVANYKADPQPQVWADVADNPGGGARANTTFVLKALHRAGITKAAIGLQFDPVVTALAHGAGLGQTLDVVFTSDDPTSGSDPYPATVTVLHLTDKPVENSRGMGMGLTDHLGRAAALQLEGGLVIVVTELRRQIMSHDYFAHFGLKSSDWDIFVVKSRGHFRAGFADLPHAARIVELNLPGLAPPDLTQFPFQRRKRPLYPLEDVSDWR